ncbi:TetR/AcrR family transcriptional regulator C-terminal domain-containing protein [Microbacterium oleivorans]|uniref:TetR/AcrR family transcriptional regulator n=1 Tax=Microbacterium TaxID=33882 RepID=UPI00203B24F0|nr:TetR/AcrR family transcriptional regulator C-terminal domain-containing protein [Microbacterium oleivorans]MCM3695495.1 TetR/AcrR family transcriptional regulator C-terminal domain-containing protein [Microbacterium oleivorans]
MTIDPRQARTSAALRAALVRLLADRPLAAVSVAELCREAGVHRTTFYKHAAGVDEFAVAMLTEEIDTIAAIDTDVISEADAARVYHAVTRRLLEWLAGQRDLYRALLDSSARGALRSALGDVLRRRAHIALQQLAEAGISGAPRSARDREEAAAFIAGGLVGVMDVWIREDDTDAAAAEARIFRLMPEWWPGVH